MVGDSFIHPVKEFTVDSGCGGIVVLEFDIVAGRSEGIGIEGNGTYVYIRSVGIVYMCMVGLIVEYMTATLKTCTAVSSSPVSPSFCTIIPAYHL